MNENYACRILFFGVLAGLFCLSAVGYCAEPPPLASFFPAEPGTIWKYVGEGNEYASFTQQVMFRKGQRVQVSVNNGGTRTIRVYRFEADAVRMTLSLPEIYDDRNVLNEPDNENKLVMKMPLVLGGTWQDDKYLYRIVSTSETVTVPAGTFSGVLKIKSMALTKEHPRSTFFEYYAAGVGLIMQEFSSADGYRVVSRLKSIHKGPVTK